MHAAVTHSSRRCCCRKCGHFRAQYATRKCIDEPRESATSECGVSSFLQPNVFFLISVLFSLHYLLLLPFSLPLLPSPALIYHVNVIFPLPSARTLSLLEMSIRSFGDQSIVSTGCRRHLPSSLSSSSAWFRLSSSFSSVSSSPGSFLSPILHLPCIVLVLLGHLN